MTRMVLKKYGFYSFVSRNSNDENRFNESLS